MIASTDREAPITLVRLIVAFKAMSEKEIVSEILRLTAFCAFLAVITALITWGIPFGK
jgi:type IV secretory pathway TrbL component